MTFSLDLVNEIVFYSLFNNAILFNPVNIV